MSRAALSVAFAEDDPMFRLAEAAVNRSISEDAQRSLGYFFGDERIDEGARLLLEAADAAGVSREVVAKVAADGQWPSGTDVLVVEAVRLSRVELQRNARPQLIQKFGEVLDNIDVDYARAAGIAVDTMQRQTTISVAEHVLGMMFALARRLLPAHHAAVDMSLRTGSATGPGSVRFNWGDVRGVSLLRGRTLGLVGFGEIGRAVALRAVALGMEVLYHKRTSVPDPQMGRTVASPRSVTLEELLACADVVSIHVPANETTVGMIGAAELALLRSTAWLINTSRGAVVDEDALEHALRSHQLAGAGLDVHQEEPLPTTSGLIGLPNVVMTPHVASGGAEFVLRDVHDLLVRIAKQERRQFAGAEAGNLP